MRYRANIIIEKVTQVEVEACSLTEAEDAIRHNLCEATGDSYYQNPRLEQLTALAQGYGDDSK